MKKILSLILIFIFLNINTNLLFAEDDSSSKDLDPTSTQGEAEDAEDKYEEIKPFDEAMYDASVSTFDIVLKEVIMRSLELLKDAIASKGNPIGMAVHGVINTLKRTISYYDTYDVGVHVYIDSNEVIDPAKNKSKYTNITQTDTKKTSIAIYVEDLNKKNDASESYVYNTIATAFSYAGSGYAYLHSNSGAGKSSKVGGVMNSSLFGFAYTGDAVGIYTEAGTIFTGGNITTEGNVALSLGVSYNDIIAADSLWTAEYTNWGYYSASTAGSGDANSYGIFADGDWSAIDVLYNNIESYAYYGDAVGIKVIAHTFSDEIIGNNVIAVSLDGSAVGMYFDLSSESLPNVEASFSWTILYPDTESLINGSYEKYEVDVSVDEGTLCIKSISGLLTEATGTTDAVYATIHAAHTNGEDTSVLNTDADTVTAMGILFTGGSYVVNEIVDYNIIATTAGSGAYGIVFDYSDTDNSIIVGFLEDLNITVSSSTGLAAGIYLDTNAYNEDGSLAYDSNKEPIISYSDAFINLIRNISVDVSAYGNVYGYALGTCFGYAEEDDSAGFAFYNSAYGCSYKIAENIDYGSISLIVTSLGMNNTGTNNAAYGMFLSDTDYSAQTVTMNYSDLKLTMTDAEIVTFLGAMDITATTSELSDIEIVLTNPDLNTMTGDLAVSINGENYSKTSYDITGMGLDAFLDFSFKYIEVTAAGRAFGVYLDDATLGTAIKTEIVVNATSPEGYGVALVDDSTLYGLGGSIAFKSVEGANTTGVVYMTGVSVDSTSYITEIFTDISFDLTYMNNFELKGISLGDASSLGSFSGTLSTSTSDDSTNIVKENFYGYLIGKGLASNESLMLYNDDESYKNSEGIIVDSSTSISLNNIAADDSSNGNVYGAYVTGSSSDVEINFDISVPEAVGIAVYDGATVSLVDNTISGKYNYLDGANTELIINEGASLKGDITITDGATLSMSGAVSFDSNIDLSGASTLNLDGDISLSNSSIDVNKSTVSISGSVSFYDSNIELSSASTLDIEAYETIYLDANSDLVFDSGSLLTLNLSDVNSIINYTIITAEDSSDYNDILTYLSDESNSNVVLSSVFDDKVYTYATFGDNDDGDMTVSYKAVFTGDGSTSINVTVVAIGEFDYFKLAEDSYGNLRVETTKDANESTFSAFASVDERITAGSGNIEHSFVNLSTTSESKTAEGGAIYNYTSTVGTIDGDLVGNYAYSSSQGTRGGAIFNYSTIGNITGEFVTNYALSDKNSAMGGAIYSHASNGTKASIGTIEGDFLYNYAIGSYARGGAIFQYSDANNYASIGNITGDFISNYIYSSSSTSDTQGGAIYNHSSGSSTIGTITGDFTNNYAYSTSGNVQGGAIYNYAQYDSASGDIIASIGTITGDFSGNYAHSASGSAEGGAIYNYEDSQDNVDAIMYVEGEFSDNYVQAKTSVLGGAVYNENASIYFTASEGNDYYHLGNWASLDSVINASDDKNGGFLYNANGDVYFNTSANSSITIGDGSAGYDSIAGSGTITKTGDGTLAVNSSMQYYTGALNVNEGTFSLSSGIGADVSVSDGAVFYMSTNDSSTLVTMDSYNTVTMYSGSSISLNEGATLLFDAYASVYIEKDVTVDFDSGSIFSIDFTGVYQEFEYTLFEIEDASTYDYVKKFLQDTKDIDLSSAKNLINLFEDTVASTTFNYGDSTDDIGYTFVLNFYDTEQTIDIELTIDGDFAYFAWGTDSAGNLTLSEVDITDDKDLITYSFDNTTEENASGDITHSFLGLSSANGGAVYNDSSSMDITIGSITGDFVGNFASESGGAIYNYISSNDITIDSITSVFVGNSVYSKSDDVKGGAIANIAEYGSISLGTITGDFSYNYASSSSDSAKGGAIYNHASTLSNSCIEGIVGDFTSNYVYSESDDARGGAIYNESNKYAYATVNNITSSFIGNYAYTSSSSDSAHGGAIYNYADGGEATINLVAANGDICFTGNYVNNAGDIAYEAIYNTTAIGGISIINFNTSNSYSIIINDGISGGSSYISGQILNINATDDYDTDDTIYSGIVEFNNSVENQTIQVHSGTLSLGSYSSDDDAVVESSLSVLATASLNNSNLTVSSGATLNISGSDVAVYDSSIALDDGASLSINVYSSLYLDEDSTISIGDDFSFSINMNDTIGMDDFVMLTIENDDIYDSIYSYLDSLYYTLDIGVAIADCGDNFYNIRFSSDGEDIVTSAYLAGEITYFQWETDSTGNLYLLELENEGNYIVADLTAYSASNNHITGSTYWADVSYADLYASFAGLTSGINEGGGAIYNESSTTKIAIGELYGDFLGNHVVNTSILSQGGAIYNYASTYGISFDNIYGDFFGNYVTSTVAEAQGGAIYNHADSAGIDYALIVSDFYCNYAYSSYEVYDDQISQGGAIYNCVSDNESAYIQIEGIRGTFENNYVYTVTTKSQGGAIYNEADGGELYIAYIVGDFYSNYAAAYVTADAAKSGDSYGGAIYNYASGGDIEIGYITGDFLGNYASSYYDGNEALGGAIYNYAESGAIDMTLSVEFGDIEMAGNYTQTSSFSVVDGTSTLVSAITYNAIYNSAGSDGISTINFVAGEDASVIINDGISGGNYYVANQVLNINPSDLGEDLYSPDDDTAYTGTVEFNNLVENQTINVYNGTLNFAYYEGTDDLFDDGTYVVVDSSVATLNNVDLTVYDGANLTFSIDSEDDKLYIIDSTITLSSSAYITLDNCADIVMENSKFQMAELSESKLTVNFNSLSSKDLTLGDSLLFLLEDAASINHNGDGSLNIYGDLDSSTEFNLNNGTLNFGGIIDGVLNVIEGADFNILLTENNMNKTILTGSLNYEGEDSLAVDIILDIILDDIFALLGSGDTTIYDTTDTDYSGIDFSLNEIYTDGADLIETDTSLTLSLGSSITATRGDDTATFSVEDLKNTITVSGDYVVGEGESYKIDVIDNSKGSLTLDGGEISLNEGVALIIGDDDADLAVNLIVENGTLNATEEDSQIKILEDITVGDLTISGNLYGDDVAMYGSSLVLDNVTMTGSIALENIAISGDLSYDVAEGEEARLLTISEDNTTISGELYVTNTSEGSLTVYEVTSSTGDVTFADGAVISLEGTGYVLANDHDYTGDNGINVTLEGEASIIGNIKVESPFTVNTDTYTDTDGETYIVEDAKLTLEDGKLETGDADSSNSDDVTVNGATLSLENYTVNTSGGDINLINATLVVDASSALENVTDINMTTDSTGEMSTVSIASGATIGDTQISIVGSASMLKDATYTISYSGDVSSLISDDNNEYGTFSLSTSNSVSSTTTLITVDSLKYFQENATNVNEMALGFALDEISADDEELGDDIYNAKVAFKLALDESGLSSVIMDSYSNIAEVNSMLLSNLNFASVNRARAILDKSTLESYISEEEIVESATGVDLRVSEEVATIKYTKFAQLQSINLLGSKDSVGGISGYDYWSVGSLANLDNILSEYALVGVSIGGNYSKTEGDDGDNANSTAFLLNAYGVVKSGIYPFEIFANIGYAHFWNEASKEGLSSKWDSDAFNVLGGIAFDVETGITNLKLKPMAMLNMLMLHSESAYCSDIVNIDKQSYISAKIMAGIEVEYAITSQFNALIRAMYSYECGDESYDFNYSFSDSFGGAFVNELSYIGAKSGRSSAVVGLGLSYDFSETCIGYFDYNAYVYENLITHSLNFSVGFKF